jgi:cysteine sulfinate desulfinase/cysteine desulfurase-like protein
VVVKNEKMLGSVLQAKCEKNGLIVGLGSACSANSKGNRVLMALGLSKQDSEKCIRISFSPFTTQTEIQKACEILHNVLNNS